MTVTFDGPELLRTVTAGTNESVYSAWLSPTDLLYVRLYSSGITTYLDIFVFAVAGDGTLTTIRSRVAAAATVGIMGSAGYRLVLIGQSGTDAYTVDLTDNSLPIVSYTIPVPADASDLTALLLAPRDSTTCYASWGTLTGGGAVAVMTVGSTSASFGTEFTSASWFGFQTLVDNQLLMAGSAHTAYLVTESGGAFSSGGSLASPSFDPAGQGWIPVGNKRFIIYGTQDAASQPYSGVFLEDHVFQIVDCSSGAPVLLGSPTTLFSDQLSRAFPAGFGSYNDAGTQFAAAFASDDAHTLYVFWCTPAAVDASNTDNTIQGTVYSIDCSGTTPALSGGTQTFPATPAVNAVLEGKQFNGGFTIGTVAGGAQPASIMMAFDVRPGPSYTAQSDYIWVSTGITTVPPLRQWQRDDQGRQFGSRSIQGSIRQGPTGTYAHAA